MGPACLDWGCTFRGGRELSVDIAEPEKNRSRAKRLKLVDRMGAIKSCDPRHGRSKVNFEQELPLQPRRVSNRRAKLPISMIGA